MAYRLILNEDFVAFNLLNVFRRVIKIMSVMPPRRRFGNKVKILRWFYLARESFPSGPSQLLQRKDCST